MILLIIILLIIKNILNKNKIYFEILLKVKFNNINNSFQLFFVDFVI